MNHILAVQLIANASGHPWTYYVHEVLAFLVKHAGLLIGGGILVLLWRIGGTVLWHLLVVLAVGVLLFPSVAPPSVARATGKVSTSGHAVGSTGLSLSLLLILLVIAGGTFFLVLRSPRAAAARGLRKEAGGGGE